MSAHIRITCPAEDRGDEIELAADVEPADESVGIMAAYVYQPVLPLICPTCKHTFTASERKDLNAEIARKSEDYDFYEDRGIFP